MAITQPLQLLAPLSGVLLPLDQVPDPVFSSRVIGDGLCIDPTSQILCAPLSGVVSNLQRSGHALSITGEQGQQVAHAVGRHNLAALWDRNEKNSRAITTKPFVFGNDAGDTDSNMRLLSFEPGDTVTMSWTGFDPDCLDAYESASALLEQLGLRDRVESASRRLHGMVMVSPMMFSLPLKLIVFALADGWALLATSLVQSYIN